MNYPPLDLSAFSHWPDALTTSEEEIAMWAQLGEYTQPGPDEEGVPLDILDATLAWGTSRTTPVEFDFEENLVSIFAFVGRDRIYTYIRHSLATGRPEARWPRAVPAIASLSWTLRRWAPRLPGQPWSCHLSSPTTRARSVKDILSPNQ